MANYMYAPGYSRQDNETTFIFTYPCYILSLQRTIRAFRSLIRSYISLNREYYICTILILDGSVYYFSRNVPNCSLLPILYLKSIPAISSTKTKYNSSCVSMVTTYFPHNGQNLSAPAMSGLGKKCQWCYSWREIS